METKKDTRSVIKIEPTTRDRLKEACAKSRETYNEWIARKLKEKPKK